MRDELIPLSVSIRDLPAVHVIYTACRPGVEQADFAEQIRAAFQRVMACVRELGHDPLAWPSVGAIYAAEGQLSRYECCIQVPAGTLLPEGTKGAAMEGMAAQDLPGGRFAVLLMDKDPAVIGPSIGRFYQEYVPQHRLDLDGTRPSYEIYTDRTMEYCVPLR